MTHILVKFVEDGLYHVCPRSHVRYDVDEIGLVSAKYKGIFFRAVVVSEGDKEKMEVMRQRCILNDNLVAKYKFSSPVASCTVTDPGPSTRRTHSIKKNLFLDDSKYHSQQAISTEINTSTSQTPLLELQRMEYEYHDFQEEGHLEATHHQPHEDQQQRLPDEVEALTAELVETDKYEDIEQNQNFRGAVAADHKNLHQENFGITQSEPYQDLQHLPDEDQMLTLAREETEKYEDEEETQNFGGVGASGDKEQRNVEENVQLIPEERNTYENIAKKKYYCPYCRSLYSKFARHLFQVHSGEEKIKAVAALEAKHPDRLKLIAQLRAEGIRIYNALSPSKLIVPRNKLGLKREEYVSCFMCGNMYKSKFLFRHVKRCPSLEGGPISNPLKTAKLAGYKKAHESDTSVIQFSTDVLSGLREGEAKQVIETDNLIREYGIYLCSLYGSEKHLINLIRRKLRQVAEVLIEIRKLDKNIINLSDIFCTTKKSTLFQAIRNVCKFEGGVFKRPAMANEMGTLLQHCARRRISSLLENNENEKVKDVKRWLELVKADYNALISKRARRNLDENKWNKPKTLPLTEDIHSLNVFVRNTAETAVEILRSRFDYIQWENLNKATMAKILIFNRKRVGDVQRIRIDDVRKSHNIQKESVTYELLSESEKIVCEKYMRVEVRGKHGKGVPMLLTKDIMKSIELILLHREEAGVPASNPFVFGKNKDSQFPTSVTLRYFAYNCGAKSPKFLTGTKLRQQIATTTQAFDFSDNDLAVLATYLGHTSQTHRAFYRLPDEAIQLAKISKVLEIVDSGRAAELKGKTLAELENYVTDIIEEANVEGQTQGEGDFNFDIPLPTSKSTTTPKKKRTVVRRTWTTPEKHVMKKYFKPHLSQGTLPTPDECKDAKFKFSPLRSRTVEQIKAWVNNYNKRQALLKKSK